MKILFAALAAFLTTVAPVSAASFNLNTAKFTWTAGVGGGSVDTYRVHCGTVAGTYTLSGDVAAPTTTLPVKTMVVNAGAYFCAVEALNAFGGSPLSNEVNFTVGIAPNAPSGLGITP